MKGKGKGKSDDVESRDYDVKPNVSQVKQKRKDRRDRGSSGVRRKKAKVDLKFQTYTASVGRGCNINERHVKQLQSLLALMPVSRNPSQVTDNMDEVLERPDSSVGLYFEWAKKEDRYFLWVSKPEEGLRMKFEFDGGFERIADKPTLRNPVLVFSDTFACDSVWEEVQQWLQMLFEHPMGERISSTIDFLLAFTRTGGILHCSIFKPLNNPDSDAKDGKVEEVCPVLILKPLEIHRLVEMGNSSKRCKKVTVFLDEELILFEKKALFNDCSCRDLILHNSRPPDSYEVLLSPPSRNSELFGFNTTCEEFFERYHVFRKRQVPGTGPDPNPTATVGVAPAPAENVAPAPAKKLTKSQRKKRRQATAHPDPTPLAANAVEYAQLTVPMTVFCRGLIKYVLDILKKGLCLSDFTEKDIFMRGGRVAILGVKLLQHSEEQSRKNCREVHIIITERMGETMLDDVHATLKLLKENNPLSSYDLTVNSVAWMLAIERNHTVLDLYEDFMEHLLADSQVAVMKNVEGMGEWVDKFKKIWLIYANLAHGTPGRALASDEGMSRYLEKKANELQNNPEDLKMDLLLNTDAAVIK